MGQGGGGGGRAPSPGNVARNVLGGAAITPQGRLRNATPARLRRVNRALANAGSTARFGADGYLR